MDWSHLEHGLAHSDNDKRIHALHQLEHLLTTHPDEPVPQIDHLVDELKPLLKNGNGLVSTSALACLPPLFITPSWSSASTFRHALALLVPWDKLADAKPTTRQLAARTVITASRAALQYPLQPHPDATGTPKESPWTALEAGLRGESGFASKNARAREQACLVLAALRSPDAHADAHATLPPLRPFTPVLLPLLADADPAVRAAALETTSAVFSHPSVSDAARTDLKKELQRLDISKRVQDQILAHVFGGGGAAQSILIERSESQGSLSARSASEHSVTTSNAAGPGPSRTAPGTRPLKLARSPASSASNLHTPSLLAALPPAQSVDPPAPATTASAEISPVYIASERDLDAEFAAMHPAFEGRESEHNWTARDRSVAKIRGMLLGGVVQGPLQAAFVRNVREVQDGIIKTASSLRTTVALSALALISELASTLTPSHAVESLLDGFLSHCLSMAGQTKKIVASGSQATVTTLLEHSNYHLRTVQLVCALLGEKTASARQFGAQHVLTLLRVHVGRSKHALDTSGGTGELESAVRKGLADANPQVREVSRVAFWEFERGWPDRAASIVNALDVSGRKLLDKVRPVEGEPNQQQDAAISSPARPGPAEAGPSSPAVSLVRARAPAAGSGGATKKPSVREAMMAARKKMLADKENGTAPAPKDGFIAFGDTPLAPPVPAVPDSPNGAALETPTRPRNPAHPAFSPDSPASPSQAGLEYSPRLVSRSRASVLPEPIVDDALREQARQAELAAERLLELSLDEAESDPHNLETLPTTITPRSDRRVARTPRTAGPAGGQGAPYSTPLPNPALRHLAKTGDASLFKDSPDPRDATGAAAGRGGWWAARGIRGQAENGEIKSAPLDDAERNEIAQAVSRLQSASRGIDIVALRRLSQLSRERPAVETLDGHDALSFETTPRERSDLSSDVWRQDRLFDKVYTGLRSLLLRTEPAPTEAELDAALRLLKDLAENQSSCFVGAEAGLFELLFNLRENSSRSSIAATELVATSFADRLEPVYGLGVLKPAVAKYLSTSSAPSPGSFALGLRLIGRLYEKLPGEVLEDVLPQTAEILQRALNDSDSGDLRRAAIMTLVAAQASLKASSAASADDGDGAAAQKLDELVGGLRPDQRNLVAYYSSRRKR